MTERPTVVIIEDHAALRKGLELLLRAQGIHVIGVAGDTRQGLQLARSRKPNVAIVDVELEDGSGVDVARTILAEEPDAGVLIYTGISDRAALEQAAGCGARGFVLKAGGPEDLVKAIHTLAAGGVHIDPALARTLSPAGGPDGGLSAREREILDLLASGLTGEQVAAELFLSAETVRTHVRNAMRKLGAKTRVHAIALAVRQRSVVL